MPVEIPEGYMHPPDRFLRGGAVFETLPETVTPDGRPWLVVGFLRSIKVAETEFAIQVDEANGSFVAIRYNGECEPIEVLSSDHEGA